MIDEIEDPETTLPSEDSRVTERIGPTPPLYLLKDLAQLAGHLGRVQERAAAGLDETDPSILRGGAALVAIEAALARIERKVDLLSGPRPADGFETVMARLSDLIGAVSRPGPVAQAADPVEPAAPGPAASWERVILGDVLGSDPRIAEDRRRLLEGFLARDPAACSLAAHLLLFQCSPPARIPPIIKELGEAFYQWQPQLVDGATPLEDALASWVARSCEAAGLGHRIELVRPGSRYDPHRHRSQDRGVEVSRALGWVVLREDGSVFQKASVAAR